MNAHDVLMYGDKTLLDTFEELSDDEWDTVGATSQWTPKDALAHLTAYELLLADVMEDVLHPSGTKPTSIEGYSTREGEWSTGEVVKRKDQPRGVVMKEYEDAHTKVMDLAKELGPDKLREVGTIPWYGNEYSLDDFIVYANYAHKREHSGMIHLFLKNLRKK